VQLEFLSFPWELGGGIRERLQRMSNSIFDELIVDSNLQVRIMVDAIFLIYECRDEDDYELPTDYDNSENLDFYYDFKSDKITKFKTVYPFLSSPTQSVSLKILLDRFDFDQGLVVENMKLQGTLEDRTGLFKLVKELNMISIPYTEVELSFPETFLQCRSIPVQVKVKRLHLKIENYVLNNERTELNLMLIAATGVLFQIEELVLDVTADEKLSPLYCPIHMFAGFKLLMEQKKVTIISDNFVWLQTVILLIKERAKDVLIYFRRDRTRYRKEAIEMENKYRYPPLRFKMFTLDDSEQKPFE
jgi:hypothetical protein